MRLRIQRLALRRFKQAGSTLVITLLLVGILAMAVGVALLNVQNLSRSTNDKMAYERCYHAAMGGIEMAAGWMRFPGRAATNINSTFGTKITGLTSCTLDMATAIVGSAPSYLLASSLTPASIISTYYAGQNGFTADGDTLADGRRVIYKVPDRNGATDTGEKLIMYKNDSVANTNSDNLFDPGAANVYAYTRRLRVTTPFPGDNLRNVSLIVESEAVAAGAGNPKTRIVRERMLLYPPVNGTALLSVGASVIAGAAVDVQGNSSLNIHWGPVWGKTDIHLLSLDPLVANVAPNSLILNADANKYYGSGINYGTVAGVNLGDEKWLSWQAAGTLFEDQGNNVSVPIFPPIGGITVTDFFNQLLNGAFTGYNAAITSLTGSYASSGVGGSPTTINNGTYMWTAADGSGNHALGNGALVQNWPGIASEVDDFINNTMSYTFWKSFSQTPKGYYLKPVVSGSTITGFTNASGQPWYVNNSIPTLTSAGATPLTSLGQISMKNLVPASNNPYDIADVALFIDTPEGTAGGTQLDYALGSSDAFFWKGLFYLNGNLSTSGGGAFPDVYMRNPDEFAAAMADGTLDQATHGRTVSNCYMDGVLFITGLMSRTGNASVYGTLCAKGGYGGTGSPDIYYNSRNKNPGLFSASSSVFRVISGPIEELNSWPG